MPFATTWIDLEIITLSEVSQTEKDKYHMISYDTYWNLKKKTNQQINLFTKQKETHRQKTNLWFLKGGEGRGIN